MKKNIKLNLLNFFLEYKWIFFIFLIFLIFQIYQSNLFFWDPFVYQLNGKWFCGEQIYFEFLRPPLPAIFNCLVGGGPDSILLTQIISSFVYLIAVLFLFISESKNKKMDQLVFALVIFLAPQIFLFGNYGGDFFALSFLMIALLMKNSFGKGLLFGLSTLARYNFFFYLVLLIDYKKIDFKEILKIFVGFFITWVPWLIYNFYFTGSFLFSIEETTYLNFLIKGVFAPIDIYQIALVILFLVILNIGNLKKNLDDIFARAGLIAIAQFVFSGIKEARFLNVFVLFQATNLSNFLYNKKKIKLITIFLILTIFIFSSLVIFNSSYEKEIPNELQYRDCRIMSDNWVYLYKENIVAEPLPQKDSYFYFLENGVDLLIYDYFDLNIDFSGFQTIKTNDYYFIKSNYCQDRPDKYELLIWRGNNPQK